MATVAQLMQANLLEVFNERDDQRRRAAIERTYGDDGHVLRPGKRS
jgi:hypothetical protein